ncbi:MAG TPA: HD domain-containing phosphohydrolase [Thermoanaerobaculia bacterium]|nr:HD domain-containing phosphohydrolase [Thermoanaerobaculia bacterium]HUM30904.1 HD domain-containing phosphohydrolase [Thermoanaerobaculia bacterium]HXK69214.1 HD domain-containing phosphohydrolase [Thermoanaerobaculia bacterium]
MAAEDLSTRARRTIEEFGTFAELSGNRLDEYKTFIVHLEQECLRGKPTPHLVEGLIKIHQTLTRFGDCYSAYKLTKRFMEHWRKRLHDDHWFQIAHLLAVTATNLGFLPEGEHLLQTTLQASRNREIPHVAMHQIFLDLGRIHQLQSEYHIAVQRFQDALHILDNTNQDDEVHILRVHSMIGISECMNALQEHQRALDVLSTILNIPLSRELLSRAYGIMVESLVSLNRWEKARSILYHQEPLDPEGFLPHRLTFHRMMGEQSDVLSTVRDYFKRPSSRCDLEEQRILREFLRSIRESMGSKEPIQFFRENELGRRSLVVLEHLVDRKDFYNQTGHGRRTRHLTERVSQHMGMNPGDDLVVAATLHDLGKVMLPFSLLNRIQELDLEDRELLENHAILGHEILSELNLQSAATFVLHHHERYDGLGYPYALKNVPSNENLLFLCSSYDAMIQPGPMRKGHLTRDHAIMHIKDQSGKAYHPELVSTFLTAIQ